MSIPSVSILTITHLHHNESLQLLLNMIKSQTYKNIKEWIIVDGSTTIDDITCSEALVNDLIRNSNVNFNIRYIKPDEIMHEYALKNYLNDLSTGDIMIYMSHECYYFPRRVEHAVVQLLSNNEIDLAVCNNYYAHDFLLNRTIKYNNTFPYDFTFAYKRRYLENHKYDANQEISFTNNFSEKVILLLPEHTCIQLINNDNYEKYRKIFLLNYISIHSEKSYTDTLLNLLMPNEYLNKYNKMYNIKEEPSNYDIVYLTGIHGIIWDPKDEKLGGSEQAVVKLSEEWVKSGKSVAVYGNFSNDIIYNGVEYIKCEKFPFHKKFNTLIGWRTYSVLLLADLDFKANNLLLDFHDNFSYTLNNLNNYKLLSVFNKTNKYMFKSQYHKDCFNDLLRDKLKMKPFNDSQYSTILNGIRVDDFKINKSNYIRNPYRFCYCSSYDRGLEPILLKIWKHIYDNEPLAELHVYYGMDYIYDDKFKTHMTFLLGQKGVMDHGRQPMDIIIREKYLSTFQLYLSTSNAEIDCINIRESLVAKCIPIISKFGVFGERDGLQYDWDPSNDEKCKEIALDIVNKMRDNTFIENARSVLFTSNTIVDWKYVANKWLQVIDS